MALSAVRDFYDLIRNLAKILVVGVIALLQLLPSTPSNTHLELKSWKEPGLLNYRPTN